MINFYRLKTPLRLIGIGIVLFLGLTLLLPAAGSAQDFPDVCQDPANILQNCGFNEGMAHWQSFIETGSAHFAVLQGGGECHAPLCPAGYIVTEDHFVGGIYQQVSVTKGNNYYANIVWLVFDSLANDAAVNKTLGGIGRRVGIDPFGGTDSRSPSVVWSVDNWRNDCKICNVEHVTVTAQADTITVFLRLEDTWRLKAGEEGIALPASKDQFWIDDLGLKQVGGEAIVVEAAPPTETPAPATDTPVPATDTPVAATATPVSNTPTTVEDEEETEEEPTEVFEEVVEDEVTEVAQVEVATEEVTAVTTPMMTIAPPPTLTPTQTPLPTATSRPRPTRTPRPTPSDSTPVSDQTPYVMGALGATACIGGIIMIMGAVILSGLVWLYRLGWGNSDDEFIEDETDAVADE